MTIEEKEKDIKEHPENHRHTFEGLQSCCIVEDAVVLHLMDLHQGSVPQQNPGGCDVIDGPCSCGAWH